MKIAVIGAAGLIGQEILRILERRLSFPEYELVPVVPIESLNKLVRYKGRGLEVFSVDQALKQDLVAAIFACEEFTSKAWAPQFAEKGITVIDHSTVWRMDPNCRLIVPEINGHLLTPEDKLIASPNSVATQLALVLNPINQAYGIQRAVLSTYQAVTGAGKRGVHQLLGERQGGLADPRVFPRYIDHNVIPYIGKLLENGYTHEEMKIVHETHKILADDAISITVTAVLVPTLSGHAISANLTLKKPFKVQEIIDTLEAAPGIVVNNDVSLPEACFTPIDVRHKEQVYVARIREDASQPHTINLWIVADNLCKGTAANALQIVEYLVEKGFLPNTDSEGGKFTIERVTQ